MRLAARGGLALALCLGAVACDDGHAPGNGDMAHGGDLAAPADLGPGGDGGAPGDGGGDGGSTPASCEAPIDPVAIASGHWDPSFTIAGVTGADGLVPSVRDLTRDGDGNVVATGYFHWLGHDRVPPLVRQRNGVWESARATWELGPRASYSAVAVGPKGQLTLAVYDATPTGVPRGELWVDTGTGLRVVGHFQGRVRRLVWFHDQLWMAGYFKLDAGDGGQQHLAVWDGNAWAAPPLGAADNAVYALVPDTTADGDGLLVGGSFANVGGVATRRVARWTGSAWQGFDLDYGPAVYALARGGDGTLYAGGFLDHTINDTTGGIVRWTGSAWELVGGGVSVSKYDGVIGDLVVHQGALYAAGCFDYAAGAANAPGAVRAASVARWTGAKWESLDDGSDRTASAWFDPLQCGTEGPYSVWAMHSQRLLSDGKRVYFGGSFAGVGAVASQSLISYDGSKWQPAGAAANRGLAGQATRLSVGGPDCALYAFGPFTHAGGARIASSLVRWHDGWQPLGGKLPDGVRCDSLAVSRGGEVYIGCNTIGNTNANQPRLFKLGKSGSDWSQVGELPKDGQLRNLAFDPAGSLWAIGGGRTGYVARWDQDHFTVVESGFDKWVTQIAFRPGDATGGPRLVVGGAFDHIGSAAFAKIAAWDGQSWSPLGPGLTVQPGALAYGANVIYAASVAGTAGRTVLGAWDGSAWSEIADVAHGLPAPMAQTSPTFTALLARGHYLVASGYVWPVSGGRNVFVYDGATWASVGGGAPAINVPALALNRDGLWFGGSVAEVGLGSFALPSIGVARFGWGAMP